MDITTVMAANSSLTVERGCTHPLNLVLLENGIEDEKASAGDRVPNSSFQADALAHRLLEIVAIVENSTQHQITDKSVCSGASR